MKLLTGWLFPRVGLFAQQQWNLSYDRNHGTDIVFVCLCGDSGGLMIRIAIEKEKKKSKVVKYSVEREVADKELS